MTLLPHLRVLHPARGVWGFYDGRVPGYRFSEQANRVDPWALALGICAYAVVDGPHALVYDTHVSIPHARGMRDALEAAGVREIVVVLSHWHLDHIAGTRVFADCEVIANVRTAAHLARHRSAIEAGTLEGPPAIDPVVMPTRTFDERLDVVVGSRTVELRCANVHSDDATLAWLPDDRVLLGATSSRTP